jgi:hypothetical protein
MVLWLLMQPAEIIEFMPERRHLDMQSSEKNPLEIYRPWKMDVLGCHKEPK